MSGVIQVEGKSEGAFHPQLGKVITDATRRRALRDFPPVAWFTTRVDVPKVLIAHEMIFVDNVTGEERQRLPIGSEISNGYALNRVALSFPIASIRVVRWPEYYGYSTPEGWELNESARDKGDNPDDWYLSESPVDVLQISEFWFSRSILKRAEISRATKLASGTLYPILFRLERAGWLESRWEAEEPKALGRPRRRFYWVTELGAQNARAAVKDCKNRSKPAPDFGRKRQVISAESGT
jgi:hypothetical protein